MSAVNLLARPGNLTVSLGKIQSANHLSTQRDGMMDCIQQNSHLLMLRTKVQVAKLVSNCRHAVADMEIIVYETRVDCLSDSQHQSNTGGNCKAQTALLPFMSQVVIHD